MKNNIAERLANQLTEFMLENQEKEFNILYSHLFELLYVYLIYCPVLDRNLVDNVMCFLKDIRTCIDNQN